MPDVPSMQDPRVLADLIRLFFQDASAPPVAAPLFRKTAAQEQALRLLQCGADHLLLYGGSRSGKTFILLYALLARALRAPGSRHAVLRLHGNAVRCSVGMDTLPKVVKLAYPGLKLEADRTDGVFRLPNASEIWLAGLDTQEHAEKILGREFATLYFNECSEIPYGSVTTALTRLAQKTLITPRAYYDCNPPGKTHWTYRTFILHVDPESGCALPDPGRYAAMLLNPDSNRANLPDGYLEHTLAALSERQRRRFLEGRWLDAPEGALWKQETIDRSRVAAAPPDLRRIVVGVDPAVTFHDASDTTGIVAAGRAADGRYYVLADASCKGSPAVWAAEAVRLFRALHADRIIGEVNQGGDLIAMAIRNAGGGSVPFKAVTATRGKWVRAEPVAALYEQNLVSHAGRFPELEEQLCSFVPGAAHSPDRLDALVWALTELSAGAWGNRAILA